MQPGAMSAVVELLVYRGPRTGRASVGAAICYLVWIFATTGPFEFPSRLWGQPSVKAFVRWDTSIGNRLTNRLPKLLISLTPLCLCGTAGFSDPD